MSQQEEMMTRAISNGVGRALEGVLLDLQRHIEEREYPAVPREGIMRVAIRDLVGGPFRDINRQLEGIHQSLGYIGFVGLVIAVSLIGIFAKLMGWLH